ncbi:MAG TPA: Flp pilus assembly protein CpaB [Gaiellaceae bacterium]|nr:Flp pilus assembly protein CpaB [Gaiellaceae bacterium]HUJ56660.1 Flp pilus assembly protein CpaB [Gaiellaceae bacterium]
MTYRIRNVVIAIGLALVAMMLTLLYVTNYRRSVQHSAGTVQVYVAGQDIPAGTAGSTVANELHKLSVPRTAVVPGAISSPQQIKNEVLTAPIYSGEQVTLRRFANAAAQGIRAQLHRDMRAIQVGGDPNQLLAGTLQAGDHVDLVASIHHPDPTSQAVSSLIVLRDLLVLVAPTTDAAAKLSSSGATSSVILAVSDTQVQRFYYVVKNDDWSLELRPVLDAVDSKGNVATANSVLKEGSR